MTLSWTFKRGLHGMAVVQWLQQVGQHVSHMFSHVFSHVFSHMFRHIAQPDFQLMLDDMS